MPTTPTIPAVTDQAERLIALGVPDLTGLSADHLRDVAAATASEAQGALLAIHPRRARPSALAPLLRHEGKPGFVVVDMTDVDAFAPVPAAAIPDSDVYLVSGIDRGDHLANWSPDEALPAIVADGRSPLTLTEGILWLLQQPDALERNHCFMTIGSRKQKSPTTLDTRTPAIWISNGTGRDGATRRGAPKVGWCWAGNRHTWLGFASAVHRAAAP